tara:strand:+ start:954 stop:2021 length:1068 start_codon:yes stop_codon:yes gene_type:complete
VSKKLKKSDEYHLSQKELRSIDEEIASFASEKETCLEEAHIDIIPIKESQVLAFWNCESEQSNEQDFSECDQKLVVSLLDNDKDNRMDMPVHGGSKHMYFDLWQSGLLVEAILGENNPKPLSSENLNSDFNGALNSQNFKPLASSGQQSTFSRNPKEISKLEDFTKLVVTNEPEQGLGVSERSVPIKPPSLRIGHSPEPIQKLKTQQHPDENRDYSSSENMPNLPLYWELEGVIAAIQFSGKMKLPNNNLSFFGQEINKTSAHEFLYFYPILQEEFEKIKATLLDPLNTHSLSNSESLHASISNIESILHFQDLRDAQVLDTYLKRIQYPYQFLKPLSLPIPPPTYLIHGFRDNN